MSQPTPPMPNFPPPSATKKSRTNAIIIGAAAAIIAAIVGTGGVVVQNQNDDSKPAATAETSQPAEDLAAPAVDETEEPEPSYAELTPSDFEMKLRTTRRQCFGSAGCNVTVEPDLTYTGLTGDIDPDAVYDITYEIKGDESGPVIATAELSNETNLNYRPSLITTVSSSTKVSVKITDVMMQAG
ncbi:hypothetical protein [Streptomyces sp. enrichment culture]|uniref:hypothetical protein n=1 Tax=Streptomyces sp. enrichment culture TaxID=1795815 RepID=UPI003F55ABCD